MVTGVALKAQPPSIFVRVKSSVRGLPASTVIMAKGRPSRNKKRQLEDAYSYSSSDDQPYSSKKRQKKGKNKAMSWTEKVSVRLILKHTTHVLRDSEVSFLSALVRHYSIL